MPAFTTFAVAGGNGNLGSHITRALLEEGFQVKVLTRSGSNTDALQKAGATVGLADYGSEESLTKVLEGQQVVINAMGQESLQSDVQDTLARAAAKAGVHIFVPNDFGVDYARYTKPDAPVKLHPFVHGKTIVPELLNQLGLHCLQFATGAFGSFLPWILQADKKTKTATIVGEGNAPFAATSEREIGKFVAATFKNWSEAQLRGNTLIRVASRIETPRQILERAGYTVQTVSTDEIKKKMEDLSLGVDSFLAFLQLTLDAGQMDWAAEDNSKRTGYVPQDDLTEAFN